MRIQRPFPTGARIIAPRAGKPRPVNCTVTFDSTGGRVLSQSATAWILGLCLFASSGCMPAAPTAPSEAVPPAVELRQPSSVVSSAVSTAAERRAKLLNREEWDVYYVGGARLGYGVTRWLAVPNQPELIKAEGQLRLSVKRFGEDSVSEVTMSQVESADGQVSSFESIARLGPTPSVVRGQYADGEMKISTTAGDEPARLSTLQWPRDARGFFGVEEELLCRPLQPGQSRRLSTLMPVFNQVATVELRALDFEMVELLDTRRELLRIETTTRLSGAQALDGILWTDREGAIYKSVTTAVNQTAYRTTKAIALRGSSAEVLDLGNVSLVRVSQPLVDIHRKKAQRYRLQLSDADPARVFASDESQQLTAVDGHTADVLVRAVRPGPNPPENVAEADPADRLPNSFIQSEDPRIKAMADKAAGDERDPWQTAVALERFVHQQVAEKNYSQTFATAAEVAQSLEGDCTEHAVLLAALLRAKGLPARVAIGLVYVPSSQAFGFHMWTEVLVDGRWIGIDGTLGLGGIGAGHLKLTTSSLQDSSALASLLPVAQVLGKLKIDVVAGE